MKGREQKHYTMSTYKEILAQKYFNERMNKRLAFLFILFVLGFCAFHLQAYFYGLAI